jgi:hypothetical protein
MTRVNLKIAAPHYYIAQTPLIVLVDARFSIYFNR